MTQGNRNNKKRLARKTTALLVSLLALLVFAAGGTVAWLTANSTKTNTFEPSYVACEVAEVNQNTITVQNTGDIDAFVRAAVTVNWVDDNGYVYAFAPEYTIGLDPIGWAKHTDGYFYCLKALAPDEISEDLTTGIIVTSDAPEGYTLGIEVIAEAIQSEPARAVGTAWGVAISNGNVSNFAG